MFRRHAIAPSMLCLALTAAAGAQQAIAPIPHDSPSMRTEESPLPALALPVDVNAEPASASLIEEAQHAAAVVDAVLIKRTASIPQGMKVLVTEYTFSVHESLKGSLARTFVVRETGGVQDDGSGVCTAESHKLVLGGRYLVFLKGGYEGLLFPFGRVIQIMDGGATMADESGRFIIGLRDGVPVVREQVEGLSTSYLGSRPAAPAAQRIGPPDTASQPVPEQPAEAQVEDNGPMPASALLALLRAPGAAAPAGAQPAGLNTAAIGGADFNSCGYVTGALNFACWFPDDGPWGWFNNAEIDWDNLVSYTSSGGWILGLATSGGNPIRNEAPDANNSRNNAGTPSDAQMIAGGYGSWGANGSPNGITFMWFSGGSCSRIREVDAFCNPVNITDELQFRKSMVHELGHGLSFGHEDRYVANMVSGTWREPPNYGSDYYNRMDECRGGRSMLTTANSNGGSWTLRGWRDIATVAQAHPNWGTSGDVGPNMTTLSTFSAQTNDTIQIQHLYVENRGNTAYSGSVGFTVYLSSNTTISAADYVVWDGSWSSFGAQTVWNNGTLDLTIPASIPTGDYYIGWVLTAAEAELTSGNNTGIITSDYYGGYAPRRIHITNTVPVNNACAAASVITNGSTPYSTVNATTDGPEEPNCSFCCSDLQIHNDIWYRYTATCTGPVTVDLCDSDFDTKVAVYTSCPGATTGTAIACNDDACGLRSRVSFPAVTGTTYRIRVGGYNGASGTGTIAISCASCYANCDSSTTSPVLNVLDFTCFLNRFAAGDPWANCDNSTAAPTLNVNDFVCFLNRFAAGCP